MLKSFLVCTDGSPYGEIACDYAAHLAKVLTAQLTALHVLDSRRMEGPLFADIAAALGSSPYRSVLPGFRRLMEEKGEAVINTLKARFRDAGVEADYVLERGHPAQVIVEQEVHAEAVIIGQRGEHREWGGEMIGSTLERVIRRSIKPCLVTTEQFVPIDSLLVAYDGSDVASKGLQVAGELAVALGKTLTTLVVAEGMDAAAANAVLRDALRLLEAHECRAEGMVIEGLAEDCILGVAQDIKASLIVLGAYGHTRIRELILGSTTSQIVAKSEVPVLLVR
ncbi:MAG: universal stress protein [Kiritimatiellae bacterium]|nr:universal stress protein [Kiritimatiellia bacterium]